MSAEPLQVPAEVRATDELADRRVKRSTGVTPEVTHDVENECAA